MIPDYLKPLLPQSMLLENERGLRRYFPLTSKTKRGWKWLYQTFYIIYGRDAKDKAEVVFAIINLSIDKYVERINNKLWVRTIAIGEQPTEADYWDGDETSKINY